MSAMVFELNFKGCKYQWPESHRWRNNLTTFTCMVRVPQKGTLYCLQRLEIEMIAIKLAANFIVVMAMC